MKFLHRITWKDAKMSVIEEAKRLSDDPQEMLELLYEKSLTALREAHGGILEIGTHRGASALVFMEAIRVSKKDTFLITVDPFGDRPYPGSHCLYGDDAQREAMVVLSSNALSKKINWHHYKMASFDFSAFVAYRSMSSQVPRPDFWYGASPRQFRFSLIFLDGEHIWETVLEEINAFWSCLNPKGLIIIDNANHIQFVDRPDEEFERLKPHLEMYVEENELRHEFIGQSLVLYKDAK